MATTLQGFRSLVENSPHAISLINPEGQILYGSGATTELLGYAPEELVGRNCLELIHPDDRDDSLRVIQEVLVQPPSPRQWDARVRHKDGNYCWVESTMSNLLESEVQAIVVHQRDIHARKAAEVEHQRQAEELSRSNARLEEFAYTAAHDLREPLRAITLYTEMLFRRMELTDDTEALASRIVTGTKRMFTLIDDLLSFARTGMHESPQPVDLGHTVEIALQNLALSIQESSAKVTVGALPMMGSDEMLWVRIFQNLISNAVKYRSDRPLEIQVTAERRGPDWIIRVQDNGVGIAREHQDRIFLPFVRLTHQEVPGSGLGLAVCKKIITGLGGTIHVESEVGTGSAFCLTIRDGD